MNTLNEIGAAFVKVIIVFGPIYLLAGEGYQWAYYLGILVFLSILLQRYKKTGHFSTSIRSTGHIATVQKFTQGFNFGLGLGR